MKVRLVVFIAACITSGGNKIDTDQIWERQIKGHLISASLDFSCAKRICCFIALFISVSELKP